MSIGSEHISLSPVDNTGCNLVDTDFFFFFLYPCLLRAITFKCFTWSSRISACLWPEKLYFFLMAPFCGTYHVLKNFAGWAILQFFLILFLQCSSCGLNDMLTYCMGLCIYGDFKFILFMFYYFCTLKSLYWAVTFLFSACFLWEELSFLLVPFYGTYDNLITFY